MVKNTKIGNRKGCNMEEINGTINPFTSKQCPLRAASMARGCGCFRGRRGNVIDPSAAMAVMGGLNSRAKVHVRGEGKHNKIK
jgi:hypothetical protein